jgi:Enterochelin esterase and related enzymes
MSEIAASIRSTHLGNERPIWIRRPRDPTRAPHLTLFLDGEWYRERVGASALLDTLAPELADSWFVFVSSHSEAARWRECPCHPPFAAFIADELLPWLEHRHPSLRDVATRTLIGLSYTGLAAAFIARERPGVFPNVISQSGSFWWHEGSLIEAFSGLAAPLPTAFYLSVGNRETQENLHHRPDVVQTLSQLESVRRFRDTLLSLHHSVHYRESDGAHSFDAWRADLPHALRWALPPAPA